MQCICLVESFLILILDHFQIPSQMGCLQLLQILVARVQSLQELQTRAIKKDHPDFEPALRAEHLLTRDARKVERKKYGLRKARRATQFSKR